MNNIKIEKRGGLRPRSGRKPLADGARKRLVNIRLYLSDAEINMFGGITELENELRKTIYLKLEKKC